MRQAVKQVLDEAGLLKLDGWLVTEQCSMTQEETFGEEVPGLVLLILVLSDLGTRYVMRGRRTRPKNDGSVLIKLRHYRTDLHGALWNDTYAGDSVGHHCCSRSFGACE